MLCQMCQQAEATIHVSRPVPVGPPDESHYCHACFQARSAATPAEPPAFPLSRFTIKGLMIAAGLFALPNAIVVLYMRSGLITGTPDQIRDRMIKALLIENFGFAVFLSEFVVIAWFKRYARYRKSGGATPMRPGQQDRRMTGPIEIWSDASLRERVFLFLNHLWILLCLTVYLNSSLNVNSRILRLNLGILLAMLLTILGVWVLLIWGLVDSTRRR